MTPRQELRVMEVIARNVLKLTPAGRNWLASWLVDGAMTTEIDEAVTRRQQRQLRDAIERRLRAV